MATMMPSDIGEFETEGEKTFYKFLEGVAYSAQERPLSTVPGLPNLLEQVFHRCLFGTECDSMNIPLSIMHPEEPEFEFLEVV